MVTSLKVNNLANSEVQQHIFGDIIKRQVVGEIRSRSRLSALGSAGVSGAGLRGSSLKSNLAAADWASGG